MGSATLGPLDIRAWLLTSEGLGAPPLSANQSVNAANNEGTHQESGYRISPGRTTHSDLIELGGAIRNFDVADGGDLDATPTPYSFIAFLIATASSKAVTNSRNRNDGYPLSFNGSCKHGCRPGVTPSFSAGCSTNLPPLLGSGDPDSCAST
jgi:hypothetical protein